MIHGFGNLTAVSRSAREAMHELAGTMRMGLGLATVQPAAALA